MRKLSTAVSLALHVAVIAAAVWLTRTHKPPEVVVIDPVIRPPLLGKRDATGTPSGPAGPIHRMHEKRRKHTQPDLTLHRAEAPPPPADVPEETGDEEEEAPSAIGTGTGPIGVPDGVPNGVAGITTAPPAGPVAFDEGRMTPPRLIAAPEIRYTPEAIEREIEGNLIVRCVVTQRGLVHSCRVVKSLPFMTEAVVRNLEERRYAPATIAGQPVEVDYTFNVTLRLP